MTYGPFSVSDFLKAHRLMTDGLLDESGKFRSRNAGVSMVTSLFISALVLSMCLTWSHSCFHSSSISFPCFIARL